MQIALVAVVLLAGMWFTVLKPKSSSDSTAAFTPVPTATTASAATSTTADKVAPGVKGLTSAVDKAKAASTTSDATNAKIQAATGSATATATKANATATKAKAKTTSAASAKSGTKAATAAAATSAATAKAAAAKPGEAVDPSDRLLAFLDKGKTLVILFYGKGVDDSAARKAVHRTAQKDPKHVVSAYVPISEVGKYEAITSDVDVLAAPTILVIGTDGKAAALTGYVDVDSVRQAVGDARRNAAAAKKSAK
jgi:hypothetical protein